MGYFVGIDVGTTLTSAAIWRDARVEIVELADDTTTPTPPGGKTAASALQLARMLRWVLTKVEEREGGPADGVVVTYPARSEPSRLATLTNAIEQAELPAVTTISEPEAAAANYSSMQRIAAGTEIAVYDLGGNRSEVAVLRKTDAAWEVLGGPDGLDDAAGASFDAVVFDHVMQTTADTLDLDDPSVIEAMNRLRLECVRAKEALSSEDEVTVQLEPPLVDEATEVRLTRAELEDLIRPRLAESAGVLHRAIERAGLQPSDLHTVLLIGGSSRIPLVAEVISEELQRPVAVDDHPLHITAMGAAFVASERSGMVAGEEAATEPEPEAEPDTAPEPEAAVPAAPPPPPPAPAPAAAPTPAPPPPKKSRALRKVLVAALVLALAGTAGIAAFALGGSDSSTDSAAPDNDDSNFDPDDDKSGDEEAGEKDDSDDGGNASSPTTSGEAESLADMASGGDRYETGTWTIGSSELPNSLGVAACQKVEDVFELEGEFSRFEAEVGVATENSGGANAGDEVVFTLFADNQLVGREQARPDASAVTLQAKIEGASTLRLEVASRTCTEDIAVWGNARVIP